MSDILFTYNNNSIELPFPLLNDEVQILLPFDFTELDNNTTIIVDNGIKYDKRKCNCTFILTTAQQQALNTFINTTARAKNVTLTLPATGNDLYPFGCDKGNTGNFTVSIEYRDTPKIQQNPFKCFICNLIITNVGSYPSFPLPTEIDDGLWTFGDVTKCRMPQGLFEPNQKYTISVQFTENSSSQYFDRGSTGDSSIVKYTQQCNTSKCAAILNYLTNTKRSGNFDITTRDYYYIFGADHESAATYTVHLFTDKIIVKHIGFDNFDIQLALKKV